MKLITTLTQEHEIEITFPFFRLQIAGDWYYYVAGINEQTVIKMTIYPDYNNYMIGDAKTMQTEIVKSIGWANIPEQQFIEKHEAFLKSLSLMPQPVDDIQDVL